MGKRKPGKKSGERSSRLTSILNLIAAILNLAVTILLAIEKMTD